MIRIAMWSGPRNISTALMRSFEARGDTQVVDEPFYAVYLAQTGLNHPLREEVLASQSHDWHEVVAGLLGPVRAGIQICYQKHMTHHMLHGIGRDWLHACCNAFLIRDPVAVLASYVQKRSDVALDDLGYVQQHEIFQRVCDSLGYTPAVIDSQDVLADPCAALSQLCAALGIAYTDAMLRWPAGRRASDGVWAPAWYDAVERSTGFSAPVEPPLRAALPRDLQRIADAARPYYDALAQHRLQLCI
jgi:hypothetical protein